jgi:hypothetical protein
MSWFNKKTVGVALAVVGLGVVLYKLLGGLGEEDERQRAVVSSIREEISRGRKGAGLMKFIMEQVYHLGEQDQAELKAEFKKRRRAVTEDLPEYCRVVARYMTELAKLSEGHLGAVLGELGIPKEQFSYTAMQMGLSIDQFKPAVEGPALDRDLILRVIAIQDRALDQNIGRLLEAMVAVS